MRHSDMTCVFGRKIEFVKLNNCSKGTNEQSGIGGIILRIIRPRVMVVLHCLNGGQICRKPAKSTVLCRFGIAVVAGFHSPCEAEINISVVHSRLYCKYHKKN